MIAKLKDDRFFGYNQKYAGRTVEIERWDFYAHHHDRDWKGWIGHCCPIGSNGCRMLRGKLWIVKRFILTTNEEKIQSVLDMLDKKDISFLVCRHEIDFLEL